MKVVVTLIDNETKEFNVSKNPFTLGRSKSNDISISSDGLSRTHCQIELNAQGEIVVTALNSTNGILIQGKRITPNEATIYPPFLSIAIGPIIGLSIQANEEPARVQVPFKVKDKTKKTVHKSKPLRDEKKTGHSSESIKKLIKPLIIIIVLLTSLYFIKDFNLGEVDEFELPPSPKNLNL